MPLDPNEIARHLVCPDDASPLAAEPPHALRCTTCNRAFPFLAPNLIELLPSQPVDLPSTGVSPEYAASYLQIFFTKLEFETLDKNKIPSEAKNKTQPDAAHEFFRDNANVFPFNAPEITSRALVRLRERQSAELLQLFRRENGPRSTKEKNPAIVFCDFSAGVGYTTLRAAQYASIVFHCDLSNTAVRYASAKATRLGLDNFIAVRADYLRPPFRNSIDQLTCIDTLIRGPWHELQLLATIRRSLSPRGVAVVDFHNWWHNPLRRLGLLPQNFGQNRSYSKREMLDLLAQSNIDNFTISKFVAEARPNTLAGKIAVAILPPTRFIARFTANQDAAAP